MPCPKPVSEARNLINEMLDGLPDTAKLTIDRDCIEVEPVDGYRRYKPGNMIVIKIHGGMDMR